MQKASRAARRVFRRRYLMNGIPCVVDFHVIDFPGCVKEKCSLLMLTHLPLRFGKGIASPYDLSSIHCGKSPPSGGWGV